MVGEIYSGFGRRDEFLRGYWRRLLWAARTFVGRSGQGK